MSEWVDVEQGKSVKPTFADFLLGKHSDAMQQADHIVAFSLESLPVMPDRLDDVLEVLSPDCQVHILTNNRELVKGLPWLKPAYTSLDCLDLPRTTWNRWALTASLRVMLNLGKGVIRSTRAGAYRSVTAKSLKNAPLTYPEWNQCLDSIGDPTAADVNIEELMALRIVK